MRHFECDGQKKHTHESRISTNTIYEKRSENDKQTNNNNKKYLKATGQFQS